MCLAQCVLYFYLYYFCWLMSVHLTNKPAIIALLHHINDVSLPQLQLILIARHVVVQRLVPGLEKI